jgi:uncharacterized phage protein gp47/JayE
MAGVTQYGFERKTLQEIITSLKLNLRAELGDDWNVETGSPEDQFISVFAAEADEVWQGIEGAIASQTINGAEGVYLDDVLSKLGVYRKGKTPSSGKATLFSNYAQVTIGSVIPTTSVVSASNGLTYNVSNPVFIDNFMSAYSLSASQLTVGQTYNINIYSTNTPSNRTFTWQVTSEAGKDRMLEALVVFANETVVDRPTNAFYTAATRSFYIGFDSSNLLPLHFNKGGLYVQTVPRVGNIGHSVDLVATQVGFNPLSPNGLNSLSPTYTGYVSIINGDDFNAGSDVQTDAEYRLAWQNSNQILGGGTTESIITGLLELEGVVDAEVYENPLSTFWYDVSGNTVAEPYTYNITVLGGDDSEVAQVILNKSPANTKRYGLYNTTAINSKGQAVTVNFTRASYFDVEIQVSYTTKDGSALTEAEKNSIINGLATALNELRIGDVVPTSLLQAVVFQSVPFSRLKRVNLEIKDLTLPSSNFTPDDLTADFDEKPRVLADKVSFIRV